MNEFKNLLDEALLLQERLWMRTKPSILRVNVERIKETLQFIKNNLDSNDIVEL